VTTSFYHRFGKRLLDALGAGVLLILLWPVMLTIGFCSLLLMGRPMLFRQTRIGHWETPFAFFKYRTMLEAFDARGAALPDEERLSGFGRFLRASSLDELPQLWNVLKGDMSLVGPRPLLPQYLPRYTAFQRRRHEVKPGITGWVQVNGRNSLTWEQKFEMDVWYVDNRSFLLDVKIMWRTLLRVVRRDGISQTGHATMPEFMGTAGVSRQND
jgi:lipopolysaccharide/colanic/teichoic acid biosynthesis glycosyltransferase